MADSDVVLTLDLGTSGPKVSLFDRNLKLIASTFREVELVLVAESGIPGEEQSGAEQRPADWIRAIESAIDQLYSERPDAFARVRAINVTAQWSGTVAISEQGEPLMNAIIWMDARGAPDAAKLTEGWIQVDGYGLIPMLEWIRITGGGPTRSGKDSISHILYIKRSKPEIYSKTRVFLEPKDFLNFYLTGLARASHESITVHWLTDNRDIHRIRYSDKLIEKSGIERSKLPELIPTNSILGKIKPEIARRFRVPEGAVVVAGTPDLHSAAVGSGGIGNYEPHVYIGTSSWMICHVPDKKTDLFHNMASIPSAVPGRYFMVNEQQTAGASLQFLKNRLLFPEASIGGAASPSDAYSRMDALAATVPAGAEGLFYFPWLNGERSPFDVHHVRGGFMNLSLKHEQRHMIRAVMEGVALNMRWLRGYAERFCKRRFEGIRFIGGGANSSVWAQILADVLGVRVDQVEDPLAANSRGAAALAWLALGERSLDQLPGLIPVKQAFHPNPKNQAVYDRSFKAFVEFFERNQAWYRKVNAQEKK